MKVAVIVSFLMLILLFLSIKIILFSSKNLEEPKKIDLYEKAVVQENPEFKESIVQESTNDELSKAAQLYDRIFLLKDIKIGKSKDFRRFLRTYKVAFKFYKKGDYLASKRRLTHIVSFLDDNFLGDLMIKSRAYYLLSEISAKMKDQEASDNYLKKFMETYRNIISHPQMKNIKNRLQIREFMTAAFYNLKGKKDVSK